MKQPIPKPGDYCHFFDDGKTGPGRHYVARVERVIPVTESIELKVQWFDYTTEQLVPRSLWDIWRDQTVECDWLYSPKTDYFLEVSCPTYDKNLLYFARTKEGGWFSLDIQSSWQAGRLDPDGRLYKNVIDDAVRYGMDITSYTKATYNSR